MYSDCAKIHEIPKKSILPVVNLKNKMLKDIPKDILISCVVVIKYKQHYTKELIHRRWT